MPFKDLSRLSRLHLPNSSSTIAATSYDYLPVLREHDRIDGLPVSLKSQYRLSRLHVPNPRSAIHASRDHRSAVLGERDRIKRLVMSCEANNIHCRESFIPEIPFKTTLSCRCLIQYFANSRSIWVVFGEAPHEIHVGIV